MKDKNVLIIGGGIVGLATAYQLLSSKPGIQLTLLEKEDGLAKHQTGNNSGVIHSGLYYKPGSLKAKNCIEGYHQLLAFCDEANIPYELCGKIVVATQPEELSILENLFERGQANGLKNLQLLNREEMKEIEPHVEGLKAIKVPQTGIINYSTVCHALANKIQSLGGCIVLNQKVKGMKQMAGTKTRVQSQNEEYEADLVINCSGLYSDRVARMTHPDLDVKIIPFRGEYYELKPEKEHLVKHLIYPVPDPNFPFLGVHFTRMIDGGIEAGPNAVLAFSREGYTKRAIKPQEFFESLAWPGFQKVAKKYWKTGMGEMYRSFSKKAFVKALQKMLPEIQEADLVPGGAGVRAQACDRKGGLLDDFMILNEQGAIHVCNAPSPAATSSLSIGKYISQLALEQVQP